MLTEGKWTIDRAMNIVLFMSSGASIFLVALGVPFWGAVCGLLSEPPFFYFSWKSKSWALFVLTIWWSAWWLVVAYRNY